MKAAVVDRSHKNDISVSVREVAAPACGENDVLVRVKAAGVNPLDSFAGKKYDDMPKRRGQTYHLTI